MVEGLSLTRRAALGSIAAGSGLLFAETGAFASVVADRSAGLDATDDGSALLSITGKTAETTPTFTNRLASSLTVYLDAIDAGGELDVVDESKVGNEVMFTLAPSGDDGDSQQVEMTADVSEIDVDVSATFDSGTIDLTRTFEIPQASQIDVTASVDSTGNSGEFRFGLENMGTIDAVVDSIRIDETSNDATEVRKKTIFRLYSSDEQNEDQRQLISNPLTVGASQLTQFDDDGGSPDTVTLTHNDTEGEQGPESIFEFDRFVEPKKNGNGYQGVGMDGERVTITVGFDDGSSRQFVLDDSQN